MKFQLARPFLTLFLVLNILSLLSSSQIDNVDSVYGLYQSDGLNLIYPNGGEKVSGNVTIDWELDVAFRNDDPYFNVFYSNDEGANWIQIAFVIHEDSYVWHTVIYEEYSTKNLVKVIASSKEWLDKEAISTETFTIDNRPVAQGGEFLSLLGGMIFFSAVGVYLYKTRFSTGAVSDIFQANQLDYLITLRNKVIVGLDNIASNYIGEAPNIPQLIESDPGTIVAPGSIVEIFPDPIQQDLRTKMKGRTVLVLIEIAFQNPSETNPLKIAKDLNIPSSTLSKEIKKLSQLEYVKAHISDQVLMDARYRNFQITEKGYQFLYVLNESLRITINRIREENRSSN